MTTQLKHTDRIDNLNESLNNLIQEVTSYSPTIEAEFFKCKQTRVIGSYKHSQPNDTLKDLIRRNFKLIP